jgi:2'-5' RNA ligase
MPSYHLWVKPMGAAYALLAETIHTLARELDTPPFEPHVTLLASLQGSEADHRQRAERLSRLLRPARFVLTEPAYLDEHFRCLFMLVEQTQEVMGYHASALGVFGRPKEEYMPHVSLVYGSLPESRKKDVIARLPAEIRSSFDVTSLVLLKADSPSPKDWHELLEIPVTA